MRGEAPVVAPPDVRVHGERPLAGLVDVQAARLAEPVRSRLAEPGAIEIDRRAHVAAHDLELVALAHRRLVDVPGEDEVGARGDELAQHAVPVRDRPLARRPPRRADHVVVEDDDAYAPSGAASRRSLPGAAARRGGRRSDAGTAAPS